jgi:hypothetical protein
VVLTGEKGAAANAVVVRKSIFSLVSEKTLFLRLGLVAGCMNKMDCKSDETCIEGLCKPALVDSRTLPDFTDELITHLTCDSGTKFISTATGDPMPTLGDMTCMPGGKCEEGTCYLPPPDGGDMSPDLHDAGITPAWTQESTPTTGNLRAVWPTPTGSEVFAVGDQGLILRATAGGPMTAGGWVVERNDPTSGDLTGIYGFAADDVFVVSKSGKLLHRTASGWADAPVSLGGMVDSLTALWGPASGDLFLLGALGSESRVVRVRGSEPQPSPLPGATLNAIWGSAADDVWVVGNGLTLFHFDGIGWSPRTVPDSNASFRDFRAVWSSGLDVFAVGSDRNGSFILYNFRADQALPGIGPGPQGGKPLFAVWGRSATDVYAAGEGGVVLHYMGDTWRVQQTPVTTPLVGLSGAQSSGDTWAVGPGGVVLYSKGAPDPTGDGGSTPNDMTIITTQPDLPPPQDGGAQPPDGGTPPDDMMPPDDMTPPDDMAPPDDMMQPDDMMPDLDFSIDDMGELGPDDFGP